MHITSNMPPIMSIAFSPAPAICWLKFASSMEKVSRPGQELMQAASICSRRATDSGSMSLAPLAAQDMRTRSVAFMTTKPGVSLEIATRSCANRSTDLLPKIKAYLVRMIGKSSRPLARFRQLAGHQSLPCKLEDSL